MKYIPVYALFLIFVFGSSCGGQNKPDSSKDKSGPETLDMPGPVGSDNPGIHTTYEYADARGNQLIIQNGLPKGGGYIDSGGNRLPYVVFFTQIANETITPVELKIDFPSDSFEFPSSSGVYMKLFTPSDTLTPDKMPLISYGLPVESFFHSDINKSYSLKRTIDPKRSTAFYVLMSSNKGVDGSLRAGFSLKGQSLIYKISAYKSIPGHPLMEEKVMDGGSINLENLILRK